MEDRFSSQYWGEEIRSNDVVNPVVFHFKPKQFIQVAPENLAEWEQFFLENVGLRPAPKVEGARAWAGSPGGSISGSDDGWDD